MVSTILIEDKIGKNKVKKSKDYGFFKLGQIVNDSLLSFCLPLGGALNWGFLYLQVEKIVKASQFFQNGKGYVNVDLTCGKVQFSGLFFRLKNMLHPLQAVAFRTIY